MRTPRVLPPPLTGRTDRARRCPLDRTAVHEHRWPGSALAWYSCPNCQAYWWPGDGLPGRWDDSGDVCAAFTVRIEGDAPVVLDCILGDDHGDGERAVHVSEDLIAWSEPADHRVAA